MFLPSTNGIFGCVQDKGRRRISIIPPDVDILTMTGSSVSLQVCKLDQPR